jgi:hypothetical protein
MKRYIILLSLVALVASLSEAQFTRLEYSKTVPVFTNREAPTGATSANDTTKMFDISEATDLAVFAYGSDSLKAAYWYRLRNSVTGRTGAWTEFDTIVVAATGNNPDGKVIGTVLQSTLLGYDGIQFYIDYVAGTSTGESGTDTHVLYVNALRRAGGVKGDPWGRMPRFNETWPVIDEYSWLSSTANDTIPQPSSAGVAVWMPLGGGTDLAFLGRTNDSLRVTIYYQLVNHTARDTTAWTVLDSIVTVDNLGSASYDSVDVGVNALALSTILGYEGIRFYVDYNATTPGTASNSDGTTNRWRLYRYYLRRE